MNSEDLDKLVNASGFGLQIRLETAIRESGDHRWSVVSSEHPWQTGADLGFADLVLRAGEATAVIECKRTRGGTWVFLVPAPEDRLRAVAHVSWIAGNGAGRIVAGSDVQEFRPTSYNSSFCVVRGSGENDRPLLERLCTTLLLSCDALAVQEAIGLERTNASWRGFFLPIVVTTAELYACKFRPTQVDLSGVLSHGEYEPVPFIRFTKAFAPKLEGTPAMPIENAVTPASLEDYSRAQQRTVFVVNAKSLVSLLSQFERPRFGEPPPWRLVLK